MPPRSRVRPEVPVILVYVFIALALVFAIAAVVVGREARRLDAVPPEPVFDPDEAVEWVANHLPFEVSAVLSHDDVRDVITWSLEYFRGKGVSGNGSTPHIDEGVVVGGAETVAFVCDRAAAEEREITPDQVRAVLESLLTYLEAIGAVGPEAETPPEGPAAPG